MSSSSLPSRASALSQKRAKLEAMKLRRSQRGKASKSDDAAPTGSGASDLSSYIDELLGEQNEPGKKDGDDELLMRSGNVVDKEDFRRERGDKAEEDEEGGREQEKEGNESLSPKPTPTPTPTIAPPAPAPAAAPRKTATYDASTQTDVVEPAVVEEKKEEKTVDNVDLPPTPVDDREEEGGGDENGGDLQQEQEQPPNPPSSFLNDDLDIPISSISSASKIMEKHLGMKELDWKGLLDDYGYGNSDLLSHHRSQASQKRKSATNSAQNSASGTAITARQLYVNSHAARGDASSSASSPTIVDLDHSPHHKELILTGLSKPSYDDDGSYECNVAIWNMSLTSRPDVSLSSAGAQVTKSLFHREEPQLIIGGTSSGRILVWDCRVKKLPVQRSPPNSKASNIVGLVSGYGGNGGDILTSVTGDGVIGEWDLRDLRATVEKAGVLGGRREAPQGGGGVTAVSGNVGGVVLGMEDGGILSVTEGEGNSAAAAAAAAAAASVTASGTAGKKGRKKIVREFSGGANTHFGPVTGLDVHRSGSAANPATSRGFSVGSDGLVVSCGIDWSTRVYAPWVKDEPVFSVVSDSYDPVSDVKWSPTHPGLFATGGVNGKVTWWDLSRGKDDRLRGEDDFFVQDEGEGGDGDDHGNQALRGGNNNNSKPIERLAWSHDGWRLGIAKGEELWVCSLAEGVVSYGAGAESDMMEGLGLGEF